MSMMSLQQALGFIQQRLPQARLVGDGRTALARVHTDTRSLRPGDLFVALQGERFDAHQFLPQARQAGAVAALAHGGLQEAGLAGVEVPDTLLALGALAAGWRGQFELPLIAVTGSNGKTTVTQMLASILAAHAGSAALATQGNFNNAIGVPQTLLRLEAQHRVAVVELGMNHPGEIAYLAGLAQPTVALVNNAQREHLEFMHTVQAVAQENGAVLAALPAEGVAVFPAGDAYTALWRGLAGARRCTTFGVGGDVQATQADWQGGAWQVCMATPQGALSCTLGIAGRHNVANALAATACALAAGMPPMSTSAWPERMASPPWAGQACTSPTLAAGCPMRVSRVQQLIFTSGDLISTMAGEISMELAPDCSRMLWVPVTMTCCPSTVSVCSGAQSPIANACDTMRVPGFRFSRVGRSFRFKLDSR